MNLTVQELRTLFPVNSLTLANDLPIVGMSQDTRKICPGEIYIAILGDNFDGHDFVDVAFAKGAIAALVSESTFKRNNCLYCDDTVKSLGKIAAFHRAKFSQPVIAITGSSGKTTNKEFLAHVLKQDGAVVATEGNLNNHIGLPLTIARFSDAAKYFIVEMGMNHLEEIRTLAKIARPTIGLITGVGHAHREGVGGGIENVAKAKGELFEELDENALAIVNADDPLVVTLPTRAQRITFGFDVKADVRAVDVISHGDHTEFSILFREKKIKVRIQLVGQHHVRNALAVFVIANSLGVSEQKILSGLESFTINSNRGRLIKHGSVNIIDDTYNANPDSMRAAFESFVLRFPKACKIGVLGGMLELGSDSLALHRQVGEDARNIGLDEVFAYGDGAMEYLKGFGYTESVAQEHYFTDHEKMATIVIANLHVTTGEAALLFKGSRGMKMEKVLEKVLVAV